MISLPTDSPSGPASSSLRLGLNIYQSCERQGRLQAQGALEDKNHRFATGIDVLPDDVFLYIFDFHRISEEYSGPFSRRQIWRWDRLVHVCQRWRQLIFASPLRLHLQLCCVPGTPVRKHLGCWPAFPIVMDYYSLLAPNDEDNVLAALERSNCICFLSLHVRASQLEKLAPEMRKPFPVLTNFRLALKGRDKPVLPSGFLGGSMPSLQEFDLYAIPAQGLPMLLLSARDLVTLHLGQIPPAGYISPGAMVACLTSLTTLESLKLEFQATSWDLRDRLYRTYQAPVTQTVIPALTSFEFDGPCNYVEDLVARINCPRLNSIDLYYSDSRPTNLQVSRVFKFINRSEDPRITLPGCVDVVLDPLKINLRVYHIHPRHISMFISLQGCQSTLHNTQHILQVFSQFSSMLANVRHLSISGFNYGPGISHIEWQQLLYPFTAAQTLDVFYSCVRCIALALEDFDSPEVATELLPALNLLCLKDWPVSSVAKFCAARRLSGRPVTFVNTSQEFHERLNSYQNK